MATHLEHSAQYGAPVAAVHAAFTNEQYWKDRLAEIGGPGARLESFETAGDEVRIKMIQTIPASRLPSIVTTVRPGDLVINRGQTVGPLRGDTADGTFDAGVSGAPAKIGGKVILAAAGDGSKLQVDGSVEVTIPLVGGRVESVIVEQLEQLLDREDDFTQKWIADHM